MKKICILILFVLFSADLCWAYIDPGTATAVAPLIAESDSGRVFEVTLSGEIVWEWYAGFMIKGNGKGKRRSINRMTRIPEDFFKNVEFNGRH